MLVPAARPLAVLAAAAVTLVLAGCGRDDRASTGVGIKSDGVPAAPAPAPAAPAYPALATKNTTRVPGADAAETAAQIARIVFPGGSAAQRPAAIAFADAGDWRGALAGAVLMAPPLRAPLLYTSAGEIPDATAAAVDALRPTGAPRANGAQAIRLGASGAPGGLRTTALAGSDPFTLAKSIDDYRARVAGRFSGSVVVVSADEPAYAMPAAGWAAKSGDPVLFASRDRLPAPTREAIRAHGRPRIYLVGPASVISAGVEEQLSRLGTVTRIAGRDAPATAVEFARFSDGPFGWGVTDPGHGLVFTTPPRPAGAGPAGALSASGTYGPQLLTSSSGALPAVVRDYLRDIRPGYSSDPVRGVYNHAWIVGDTDAVPETVQAEIDGLLEITRVRTPSRQP